jgi:uncharacterized membrane protein
MQFFKPTTLLDKFYEVGILIKGIDGTLELIGGVLLLTLSSGTILHLTNWLTQSELSEDPHSFVASHILHVGMRLANGHTAFAAAFLLVHGAVKVGLVTCLLLNKLWAYPVAVVALAGLLVFQMYQLIVSPTFGMTFLTVLDVAIIWLVWREWQHVRAAKQSAPPVNPATPQ